MKARGVLFLIVFVVYLIHHSLSAETSGDWTYSVTDNQATITGYSGDGGEVVIPAELDGVAVVKIGDGYPPVFGDPNTSVTSVTIPDGVTSIGTNAFFAATSLTSITIPDSVTTIGDSAFDSCFSLTSVTIGNSVTSIGQWAFHQCTMLTSITIPDSVTNIGVGAFVLCNNLPIINVDANNLNYSSVDGVLFNKFQTALIQYPQGKSGNSYTIPDGVTSIGDYTFYDSGLTSVTIPDSVTTIGDSAFSNSPSLTTITIPDSVTSIEGSAFWYCTNLTSVTIGNSVNSIGSMAFGNCTSLTTVTIPDSVTSIWFNAFYNCTSLTSVNVDADNLNYSSVDGVLFNKLQTSLITCPAGKLDDSYTIPDSVIIIGSSAFDSCASLTSVTIPDSVTSIEAWAFVNCDSLTTVTLPVTLFMEENYSSYSLSADQVRVEKTAIDTFVVTAETAARTAGQTDVTSDPATYSLFTAADVTGAETAARTLGQQDVVNAPSSFDLYTASDLVAPKFLNLSNRAYVGIGDEILIGSMMILDKPMRILVRVAGTSLANGADPVPNPLLDPTVQLVRLSDGATIKTNDNWEDDLEQKTLIESTGIPPSDSRESAMVTTVDPGNYSFVVRGVGDTTGFANLEIYEFAE